MSPVSLLSCTEIVHTTRLGTHGKECVIAMLFVISGFLLLLSMMSLIDHNKMVSGEIVIVDGGFANIT